MKLKTLKDFDFKNKRVLVRAGFDCPMDKKGNIIDDTRIRKVIPTLQYLAKKGAVIIIVSHNGRPKGKVVQSLSMDKTAQRLAKLMRKHIAKLDDCIGNDVEDYIEEMVPGEIVVLENLRFYEEEKKNDSKFSKSLAEIADIYVNDSFPTCHDKDASMIGIPRFIPGCIGFALQEELKAMQGSAKKPKKLYIAIIGGKKANKIDSVKQIMKKANHIFAVGVLANTFLKAKGIDIGKSLYDKESLGKARSLLRSKSAKKLILPLDLVVKIGNKTKIVEFNSIPRAAQTMDLGPKTLKMYQSMLSKARTVLWAGPPGVFEQKKFSEGTLKLAKKMTHVSTGGGASLSLFEGKILPAVKALQDNSKKFK